VLQCVAVCCSVLQIVAVPYSVLQCVAVSCSAGLDSLQDSVYISQNAFYRIRNIEETCVLTRIRTCVTRLISMRDMTLSRVWHDAFEDLWSECVAVCCSV